MTINNSLPSFTSNAYGRENAEKGKPWLAPFRGQLGLSFCGEAADSYVHSLFLKSDNLPLGFGLLEKYEQTAELESYERHVNKKRSREYSQKLAPRFPLSFRLGRSARFHSLTFDSAKRQRFLQDHEPLSAGTLGFRVRRYRSGEITGAQFLTGREYHSQPPSRSGSIESVNFTHSAKQKIRRAVENSNTSLKYFWTLTFAPALLNPWEKNDDGTVRHDFAKYKLKKFLNTISKKITRLNQVKARDCKSKGLPVPDLPGLGYVWVAEIQEENTNNIHFHILLDRFFRVEYMREIWAQAINSVHIKLLDSGEHGANYMRKYMQKQDSTPVQGNRYNISSRLRETMHPECLLVTAIKKADIEQGVNPVKDVQDILKAMREDIEAGGGRVLDFGFHIPKPHRKKRYKLEKDSEIFALQGKRKGDMVETKEVKSDLAPQVLDIIVQSDETPF